MQCLHYSSALGDALLGNALSKTFLVESIGGMVLFLLTFSIITKKFLFASISSFSHISSLQISQVGQVVLLHTDVFDNSQLPYCQTFCCSSIFYFPKSLKNLEKDDFRFSNPLVETFWEGILYSLTTQWKHFKSYSTHSTNELITTYIIPCRN